RLAARLRAAVGDGAQVPYHNGTAGGGWEGGRITARAGLLAGAWPGAGRRPPTSENRQYLRARHWPPSPPHLRWRKPGTRRNGAGSSQRRWTAASARLEARVERVAQPVAEEVDRQDREHDGQPREGRDPPGDSQVVAALGQVAPPLGERRLGAQAEEAE